MNRRILMIFLLFIMIFTNVGVYGESGLTNALKENLIPLKTTEAESGFEDLIPLKEILKDKKIIAMGEATHGTAEFFQMKHRVFEFLVEEMGYRIFGIEAEFGGSQVVNDYILYEEGTVEECLNAMAFWTWDTKEVAEMIEWMREFNKKAEIDDQIKFYGFDMQGIGNSIEYVLNYLEKVDSFYVDEHKISLQSFTKMISKPNKGNVKILNHNIDNIHKQVMENRDDYIDRTSIEEYELILQHLEIIYQWIDYYINYTEFEKRDYYMAENVKWILDYENKHYGNNKIMLWAHNGHVSNGYAQYINMGENLKNFFKEDYYSFGFDFYQGNFVSRPYMYFYGGLANFHIDSTPEGSYAYEMMKTGIPISFLDMDNAGANNILSDFLSRKIHINSIGALYPGKQINIHPDNLMIPKDTFDGMIFVESTTEAIRSRPRDLPNGNRTLTYSTIMAVALIVAVIVLVPRFYNKQRTKVDLENQRKFYLLEKEEEGISKLNIIENLIIRVNNYINSLCQFKYTIFAILILTVIKVLLIQTDYTNSYQWIYSMQGIFTILNLAASTIIEIIKVFIIYIFTLHLVKSWSEKQTTYLRHILIAAIIGALIITFGYRHSGVLLYFYTILLNILGGIILCYSYSIFTYKWGKPLVNISLILAIHNILMVLFTIVVYGF